MITRAYTQNHVGYVDMAHPVRQLKPVGRPGAGRAQTGRIRATILPDLKVEAAAVADADSRIASLSRLIEFAVAFYLQAYTASHGDLDAHGFPKRTP